MNSLNSILVEGNLVRDPELKRTSKGMHVCNFTIAANRYKKGEDEYQQEVSYFNVTAWSEIAQRCGKYLKKGSCVRIVGRLKQNRWQDAQGNKKSNIVIIADHVEFKHKQERRNNEVSNESW